ncbi:MAG TPA: LAGLIDADG family homing endonuclease [Burkholderiales bacterium]|nr:LAGLIDADG family homing endonuclease [Burkholderiales bacterium]
MPSRYRQTATLSPTDAAYIAGLVDGEGTISLTRRHRDDERQLVISISNTESPLLDFVLKAVGAGKITRKRTYSNNHSPGLTYAINNRQALDLLRQIAPYLRTYKVQRAKLVLDHYLELTPRNGKYSSEIREARKQWVEQFLALAPRHAVKSPESSY